MKHDVVVEQEVVLGAGDGGVPLARQVGILRVALAVVGEEEIEELDLLPEERDYPLEFSHLCGDMTGDGLGDLSSRQPQVHSQAVFYENDGRGQLRRTHIKGLDAVTGLPSYAQSGLYYLLLYKQTYFCSRHETGRDM